VTWGAVDALLGELAAVAGRPEEAIERLEAAVALETALGAPALANRSRARVEALRAAPVDAPAAEEAAAAEPVVVERIAAVGPPRDSITTNVRCFGGFHLEVAGQHIDLSGLTPRLRALAWFLGAHADEVVHTEKVIDALWPEADLTSGRRNLQVAVSALRQVVEPGARRGGWVVLAREGEGYRLVLGRGSSDLREFEVAASTARRDRDVDAAERALDLYGGDVIPEAGAATWLVERRDACNRAAADLALLVAEMRLAAGDPAAALEACERGLAIDRYEDGLWKTLIAAAEAKGDRAVAARAQKDYEAVLEDLGL
jgi:DNA-binding SARP family transcriptional activator